MTVGRTAVADHLARLLGAVMTGEVDASSRRRAEYSSDASNYRVVPQVVAFPRTTDDLLAAAAVCRETGTPLTTRGGGTSVAGNAVGTGVVLDLSRHLDAVLAIDPETATARVQPGVLLDSLQAAARPHGLRFGPDPSTHARCTIGGMIGNNACGAHAIAYGRTADNVRSLDVLDGQGRRFRAGSGNGALDPVPGLADLVAANRALLRTELGRFSRQVSGYSLEHLLPERGADLAKALVGTEGTCALVLEADVRLVEVAPAIALVVLGYPDMATAADAVPALLPHQPLAVEGIDARLVDVVRRHHGAGRVPELPAGGGWLFVEVGGPTREAALAAAQALARDAQTTGVRVVPAGAEAAALWRIREDAAVPPERLGDYLRSFDALMHGHGIDGLAYGHFGDGCVHVRLDLPLAEHPQRLRQFLLDAARLVASHGGSLSGEHGDGRARSELLEIMYSPEALTAFAGFKHCLDPSDLLNPGVLVRPRPVDADLRRPAALPLPRIGGYRFEHDAGDLTTAVHRCVGIGKCRADMSASGGFMCPSYLATRDEKDSTRGRARVLQEMANGTLVTQGARSREVAESLDLCLSCKACASDCPAGVDMATYKAEVQHRAYRRRLRPAAHYTLGWLPRWARLTRPVPQLANTVLRVGPVRSVAFRLAGIDSRRRAPAFARQTFRRWWSQRTAATARPVREPDPIVVGSSVVLWVDSFTDAFSPEVGQAAVRVLEDAGWTVVVPRGKSCCGLTWISTGQLDAARRRLRETLDTLSPYVAAGLPVVGLEPSCTAVLSSDLVELVGDDPRAPRLAAATRTLAELLTGSRPAAASPAGSAWSPPDLSDLDAVVQPHCHHHAVLGFDADARLLADAGATTRTLAGCCGLAGNFGMERGHYDVSVAVAETALLPALREARDGTVLLADGFSCRTQAEQLAGVRGRHLAEVLAERLPERLPLGAETQRTGAQAPPA